MQWGDHTSRVHANVAVSTLGKLRDVRFVAPGLDSPDHEVRLATIACLAFLPEHTEHEKLRELAASDPEPGVREAAEWAHKFSAGKTTQAMQAQRGG